MRTCGLKSPCGREGKTKSRSPWSREHQLTWHWWEHHTMILHPPVKKDLFLHSFWKEEFGTFAFWAMDGGNSMKIPVENPTSPCQLYLLMLAGTSLGRTGLPNSDQVAFPCTLAAAAQKKSCLYPSRLSFKYCWREYRASEESPHIRWKHKIYRAKCFKESLYLLHHCLPGTAHIVPVASSCRSRSDIRMFCRAGKMLCIEPCWGDLI